ncbi:MAG: saccharopine dehydrogenase NADP-binding domain-containing protein [Desulfobacterales bacterium]|jgi:saccharopine dehydrogenase-like NADP-dependent oxidoreductase|nr:saccharopine dehydrogenase NADP-binding domain-containing protein [Desulfobacterales bacterium]
MKIAVLGALGMQGKAALLDLARSERVKQVVCADASLAGWDAFAARSDTAKIAPVRIDASSQPALAALLRQGVDAVIDLLPQPLMVNAFEAALEARVPLVSTNYGKPVHHLHAKARAAGVALMPECGLDPGIDLVICGHAVKQFDELHLLNSYCGGFPEKKACTNPLNYKISWNFDMVLRSHKRPAVFVREGRTVSIPAERQHENEMIHTVHFPGLGELEAIPNGDAAFYTGLLGIGGTIREAGRYSLRWPGWCAFFAAIKRLGLLSDEPLKGLSPPLTPHAFMVRLLEPQLQYADDEKDLVAMINVFSGLKGGRRKTLTSTLLIERDLTSGLFAMSVGVGCPASIVAQMLAAGEIPSKGVLNPAVDVPHGPFMAQLRERGILVHESEEAA